MNMANKVAIVTGASSGIGYSTSLALSKVGFKVAIGARRLDKLELLKKEIMKNEQEVFAGKLDVTSRTDCNSFVDAVVSKWGRIDVLVNNAGLMPLSYFENGKVGEWDQMIEVNIKGVLYLSFRLLFHT